MELFVPVPPNDYHSLDFMRAFRRAWLIIREGSTACDASAGPAEMEEGSWNFGVGEDGDPVYMDEFMFVPSRPSSAPAALDGGLCCAALLSRRRPPQDRDRHAALAAAIAAVPRHAVPGREGRSRDDADVWGQPTRSASSDDFVGSGRPRARSMSSSSVMVRAQHASDAPIPEFLPDGTEDPPLGVAGRHSHGESPRSAAAHPSRAPRGKPPAIAVIPAAADAGGDPGIPEDLPMGRWDVCTGTVDATDPSAAEAPAESVASDCVSNAGELSGASDRGRAAESPAPSAPPSSYGDFDDASDGAGGAHGAGGALAMAAPDQEVPYEELVKRSTGGSSFSRSVGIRPQTSSSIRSER